MFENWFGHFFQCYKKIGFIICLKALLHVKAVHIGNVVSLQLLPEQFVAFITKLIDHKLVNNKWLLH